MFLSHLKDFYTLLNLQIVAKREHDMSHKWDRLVNDIDEALDDLANSLGLAMRDYLILASFGEARHSIGERGTDFYPDLLLFQDGLVRGEAMLLAQEYDPLDALPKLMDIFVNPNWSNPRSVGGEKWRVIAEAALSYWTVYKDKPIAYVDHVADVEHNGGCAFSKPEAAEVSHADMTLWYGSYYATSFLNHKRDTSPDDFLFVRGRNRTYITPINVMTMKVFGLAARCATLMEQISLVSLWSDKDHPAKYEPIQWGTAKLEVKKKRYPHLSMVQEQHFKAHVNWSPMKKAVAEVVYPKVRSSNSLARFGQQQLAALEKRLTVAQDEIAAEWIGNYPQHAAEITKALSEKRREERNQVAKYFSDRVTNAFVIELTRFSKTTITPFENKDYQGMSDEDAIQAIVRDTEDAKSRLFQYTSVRAASLPMDFSTNAEARADMWVREAVAALEASLMSKRFHAASLDDYRKTRMRLEQNIERFRRAVITPKGNIRRADTVRIAALQYKYRLNSDLAWGVSSGMKLYATARYEGFVAEFCAAHKRPNPFAPVVHKEEHVETQKPAPLSEKVDSATVIYSSHEAAYAAYIDQFVNKFNTSS